MIMITGSSGKLATLVAKRLKADAIPFISASRNVQQAGPAHRVMDFDDPATLDFSGVTALFLVSAGYGEDDVVIARHGAVLDAAERQGVEHVVYTSLTGAGDHLAFALAHRWTERRIRQGRLAWTILRNGLYAELIGALATPVDGVIRTPFGDQPLQPVARQDLADAAAAVLSAPEEHRECIYELNGVEQWTASDLASDLGSAYRPQSLAQARKGLDSAGLLPFQPAMLMSIFSAVSGGFLSNQHSDIGRLIETTRPTLPIARDAALGKVV